MILTNRLFERVSQNRDAKKIYIFCEGIKREKQYFEYFENLDSRLELILYPLTASQNNSPTGLLKYAEEKLIQSETNPNPDYDFVENIDQVWFVFDTDSWDEKIDNIREESKKHNGWNVAQSNPCFEVWLYYHKHSEKLTLGKCNEWKSKVNELISGGFDARRHPIYIENAIRNSENNFSADLDPGSTEVYKLAHEYFPLIKSKIENVLKSL